MQSHAIPRLQMLMSYQPEVIIASEILKKAACHITGNADGGGFFKDEFSIEFQGDVIEFDIDCRLIYSFYNKDIITGVIFYSAIASAYAEDGVRLETDFTEQEFIQYILAA